MKNFQDVFRKLTSNLENLERKNFELINSSFIKTVKKLKIFSQIKMSSKILKNMFATKLVNWRNLESNTSTFISEPYILCRPDERILIMERRLEVDMNLFSVRNLGVTDLNGKVVNGCCHISHIEFCFDAVAKVCVIYCQVK